MDSATLRAFVAFLDDITNGGEVTWTTTIGDLRDMLDILARHTEEDEWTDAESALIYKRMGE